MPISRETCAWDWFSCAEKIWREAVRLRLRSVPQGSYDGWALAKWLHTQTHEPPSCDAGGKPPKRAGKLRTFPTQAPEKTKTSLPSKIHAWKPIAARLPCVLLAACRPKPDCPLGGLPPEVHFFVGQTPERLQREAARSLRAMPSCGAHSLHDPELPLAASVPCHHCPQRPARVEGQQLNGDLVTQDIGGGGRNSTSSNFQPYTRRHRCKGPKLNSLVVRCWGVRAGGRAGG